MRKLYYIIIISSGLSLWGLPLLAQESSTRETINEAKGDLMRLPPLKDLLRIAIQSAPEAKQIEIAKAQAATQAELWKLANYDILSFQGVAIAGRRDVFSVNSDGTVYVPTASVVDNMNLQGLLSLKLNPLSIFQNKKQVKLLDLERDRLDAERTAIERSIAERVINAYNMAQKSLEIMDARAESLEAIKARADLAERLFRQGAMTLSEYAEFQSKASDMEAKFLDSRGDFRMYYQMLMERVYGKLP